MILYSRLIAIAICIGVAAPAASRNMVPNSSCEWGTPPGKLPECWHVWMQHPGSSEVSGDTSMARIGASSLRVVNPGDGGANTTGARIPCEPNTRYTLSVYVRSHAVVRSQVTLGAMDGDGKTLSWALGGGQTVPANTDWIRLVHSVTTPADCAYLTQHLTNHGGTTWWDGCQLERGAEATAYVESEPPSLPSWIRLCQGSISSRIPGLRKRALPTAGRR